jgi:hypothetical protein
MTQTLASDANNDLILDRIGRVLMLNGADAVAANCRSAVQAQRGEMMFAADKGMPTFATAWNRYRPVQFEAAARAIIRAVPGVVSVVSFTARRQGEILGYTAVIQTIYGEAVVNG